MDELEEKLGSILGNPQMMQSIMSMAQSLGQSTPEKPKPAPPKPPPKPQEKPPQPPSPPPALGPKELELIQQVAAFSKKTGLDPQEQALLKALHPYLSKNRLEKLKRAMRAAKIAEFASTLNPGGLSALFGR